MQDATARSKRGGATHRAQATTCAAQERMGTIEIRRCDWIAKYHRCQALSPTAHHSFWPHVFWARAAFFPRTSIASRNRARLVAALELLEF